MKKLSFIFLLLLTVFLLSACNLSKTPKQDFKPNALTKLEEEKKSGVNMIVSFNDDTIASFSGILANNAYDALKLVAAQEAWEIESKDYDFGVLIESINGIYNNKEKSWMFYVNAKLADKAADQFELQDNDQVIWKYEKPQF